MDGRIGMLSVVGSLRSPGCIATYVCFTWRGIDSKPVSCGKQNGGVVSLCCGIDMVGDSVLAGCRSGDKKKTVPDYPL